jgi:hypothetical protein
MSSIELSSDEIYHDLIAWSMFTHTALQMKANDLWDALDDITSKEHFDAIFAEYSETCDKIDLLERSPECVRYGHLAGETEWVNVASGETRCARCGEIIAYDF